MQVDRRNVTWIDKISIILLLGFLPSIYATFFSLLISAAIAKSFFLGLNLSLNL